MNLFALSFARLDTSGGARTEIYRLVPIGIEQMAGNFTAEAIPDVQPGKIVEFRGPVNKKYTTPFKAVGVNEFRSLTLDELKQYIEDKAGFGVPHHD